MFLNGPGWTRGTMIAALGLEASNFSNVTPTSAFLPIASRYFSSGSFWSVTQLSMKARNKGRAGSEKTFSPKRSIEESNRYTAMYPTIGDKIMRGKTCKITALDMLAQKTTNPPIQRIGSSKTEITRFHITAKDVALNTRNLSVTIAAKPKRLSLTHSNQLNQKLKPTPRARKTSHINQPTSDNMSVLRRVNMGSPLRINLLTIVTDMYVMAKREKPKAKLLIDGKRVKMQRLTPPIQTIATDRSTLLYDGRRNREE
jgi:hypothetical protein